MWIEVTMTEEDMVTPISFAEAVINWWMGNCNDPEEALRQRKGLGEMVGYLQVFCESHPGYEYEEMVCRDTRSGN